jgi:hypothetical protein
MRTNWTINTEGTANVPLFRTEFMKLHQLATHTAPADLIPDGNAVLV